jgi:hypothetical protein
MALKYELRQSKERHQEVEESKAGLNMVEAQSGPCPLYTKNEYKCQELEQACLMPGAARENRVVISNDVMVDFSTVGESIGVSMGMLT